MKEDKIQPIDEQELLNVTGGDSSICFEQTNRADCEAAHHACYWHGKENRCVINQWAAQ